MRIGEGFPHFASPFSKNNISGKNPGGGNSPPGGQIKYKKDNKEEKMNKFADDSVKKVTIQDETVSIREMSYGEQLAISKSDKEDITIEMLIKSITEWSLTDKSNKKIPVTKENIFNLRASFMNELVRQIMQANHLTEPEAKN